MALDDDLSRSLVVVLLLVLLLPLVVMHSFSSLLVGFELTDPPDPDPAAAAAPPEMDWFTAASALIEAAAVVVVVWKNLLILLLLMGLTVLGAFDPDVVIAAPAPPPFIGLVGAAGFCAGSTVTRIPFAVGRLLMPDLLSRNSFNFSRAFTLDAAKLLLMVAVEALPSTPAPEAAPSLVMLLPPEVVVRSGCSSLT